MGLAKTRNCGIQSIRVSISLASVLDPIITWVGRGHSDAACREGV
ncbi:hypothetical protein SCH4B_1557 [Ruegeria sp. TrichCH4B]|nr:hypothetical protein SCH4B_1557 [Ruegeria sp. TrichCH4B]